MIMTRHHGVRLHKSAWSRQTTYEGDLTVAVTQDNRLNRMSKTAKLVRAGGWQTVELMDVDLAWINEERLVLTGFESCEQDGQVVDYAQSWLCLVGLGRHLKTEQEAYEEQQGGKRRGPMLPVGEKFPAGR